MQCKTLITVLMGALLASLGPIGSAFGQSSAPVKLGVLMGFTGPAAFQATTNLVAIRMGVKEINDAGGLLGRRIDIVQADDQFNPTQAVTESRRLVEQEKVNFVIGPQTTQAAIAVAPIFTEGKVVYFSTSAAPVPTRYNFSPFMSGETMALAMVQFLDTLKVKSVAFLGDNGSAAKVLLGVFQKELPARGVELKAVQEHETRVTDVTPQLLALRRANPDVILSSTSTGEDGGTLFRNLRDIGWDVRVVSASTGMGAGAAMKVAGPDAFVSGRYFNLMPMAFTYCPSQGSGDRAFDRYLARLKAFAPDMYDKMDQKSSLMVYDALMVIKAAVEGTKSLDGPTIIDWIETKGTTLRGAAGYPMEPSRTNHFLIGPGAMTFVTRPDIVRPADKLAAREYGC